MATKFHPETQSQIRGLSSNECALFLLLLRTNIRCLPLVFSMYDEKLLKFQQEYLLFLRRRLILFIDFITAGKDKQLTSIKRVMVSHEKQTYYISILYIWKTKTYQISCVLTIMS